MKTRSAHRHSSVSPSAEPSHIVALEKRKTAELADHGDSVLLLTDDGTTHRVLRYPASAGPGGRRGGRASVEKRGTFYSRVGLFMALMYHRLATMLSIAFLPSGFPSSVTPDYLPYQMWDTVQALCSYVSGMAASQATLQGIGVGNAAATPAAALMTFLFKDVAGLLTNVVFASVYSRSFDAYPKQWRFMADVTNDVGLLVELAAPLVPSFFLPMACFGAVCRSITGVAGGATRMALTQHFSLHGNAADISAKEGSQETAVTLLGMIFGLGLTRLFSTLKSVAWIAVFSLTALHVYANMKALRALCLTKLNASRLDVILNAYLGPGQKGPVVPLPKDIASTETLLPPPLQAFMPSKMSTIEFGSLRRMSQTERKNFVEVLQLLVRTRDKSEVAIIKTKQLHGMLVGEKLCIVGINPQKTLIFGGEEELTTNEDIIHVYCLARLLETDVSLPHLREWALKRQPWKDFKKALSIAGWCVDHDHGLIVNEETVLTWNKGHITHFSHTENVNVS